jgi:hypothetical protein
MKWIIEDRVLHGIYEKKEGISDDLIQIADQYEGKMADRIGLNFPMSFVKSVMDKSYRLLSYEKDVDYIIVYCKGDIQTKRHELQHAKYAMRKEYREEVHQLWNSLMIGERKRIKAMLLKMKYPDREEILLDEFQAYYFTEKANFFGAIKSSSRSRK